MFLLGTRQDLDLCLQPEGTVTANKEAYRPHKKVNIAESIS